MALALSLNPALELGNIKGISSRAKELAEHAKRTGTVHFGPAVSGIVLEVAIKATEGRLTAAEEERERYTREYSGANADVVVASVAQLALLRQLQGRFPELESLWSAIVQRFPEIPLYRVSLAELFAHAGRNADAAGIIDQLVGHQLDAVPRDLFWKATLYLLADACAEIEHHYAAPALYDALLRYAVGNATVVNVIAYGSIARVVGRLATVLERWDEAEQHFEEALASNERQDFHAWTAWTRLNYGEMLLHRDRRGDRERAIALLQQAYDFAKESGMGKVERDSERLLASLT